MKLHCFQHPVHDPTCPRCRAADYDPAYALLYGNEIPEGYVFTPIPSQPARISLPLLSLSPPKPPHFLVRVLHFLWSSLLHILRGCPKACKSLAEQRLEVCRKCEKFNPSNQTCILCGCSMPFKVGWKDMKCPHPEGDKWKDIKGPEGQA